MPIIEIRNLHFQYPDAPEPSLRGIDLAVEEGSFVAVLGANGCGKSTLAKHLNAILSPTEGKVLVAGMDTIAEELLIPIRRTVGMVFQNPDNQIVANVVEDDVAFAPENLGIASEEIRRRVDDALHTVGMYDYRLHSPHLLSGGQKQRVAIAGVLAMEPRVLVLDEPTAMLDPQGRQEVLKTVETLCRQKGMTVILITHHMDEAARADRVLVMEQGRIVLDGSPREILSQAQRLHELQLTVPESTALILDLNRAGMCLPADLIDPESCSIAIAEALCPSLKQEP